MAIAGGFVESMVQQSSMMYYVLITSEALMNIGLFQQDRRLQRRANGRKALEWIW